MPVIPIIALPDALEHLAHDIRVQNAVTHGLATTTGPVTILLHGFKYQPRHPVHCPHKTLFSETHPTTCHRAKSWPSALAITEARLCVGFGWPARGTIWNAWRSAERAGAQLSDFVATLRRLAPQRPVHIVAHSLGARVYGVAANAATARIADRVILLAGAEYAANLDIALQRPGGRGTDILNVTSRENALFDRLFACAIRPPAGNAPLLGRGLGNLRSATLELGCNDTLRALSEIGFDIAPPRHRVCHWSVYLRPGVFDLYRAFLSGRVSPQQLRHLCARAGQHPDVGPETRLASAPGPQSA